jgi:hypothetical protein
VESFCKLQRETIRRQGSSQLSTLEPRYNMVEVNWVIKPDFTQEHPLQPGKL